jgi:FkbM family methyltransferase
MAAVSGKKRLSVLLDLLRTERPTHIVDVGSNPVNSPPYKLLAEGKHAVIVGFEPQAEAFAKLESQQSETEVHLPYAIGDGSTGELNITKSSGFTSLLEADTDTLDYLGRFRRLTRVLDRVPLETRKLDDVQEIRDMDLLKIDIQGGELAVFQYGKAKLSNAVAVITEVAFLPIYKDQPLLDDQMAELRAQGFMLHKFLFAKQMKLERPETSSLDKRTHANQLLDGDAVFIRDLRDPAAVDSEQLKHLAILADSTFHSHDLVLVCLAELAGREEVPADAAARYRALLADAGNEDHREGAAF